MTSWCSWLVIFVSAANEIAAPTFQKYLVCACCSCCSMLQKPSTFPSSTCIDLPQGDSCMLWGLFTYVISAAAVFLTCCECIVSKMSRYLLCCSSIADIPLRTNTLTMSCTLLCQSLWEFSRQILNMGKNIYNINDQVKHFQRQKKKHTNWELRCWAHFQKTLWSSSGP